MRHYDDTRSAVADVTAGEDAYGIWVAGALRPGLAPEQIRAFRASNPSGDWRPVDGNRLELVAVCMVNVPGFPVARSVVASGHVYSLVAAGAKEIAKLNPFNQIEERLAAIEDRNYREEAADAFAALEAFETAEHEALVASAQDALTALKAFEQSERARNVETAQSYATIIESLL